MPPMPPKSSSPVAQQLLHTFSSFPSDLQDSFIQSFALHLSLSQIEHLETAIFNRGRHDILSNLPLELAALVLSYLEPIDLIRNRRVNKSWFSLLTNDIICGPCLRSHFPYDFDLWTKSRQNYAACASLLYYQKPSSFVLENATSREHAYRRWEPWVTTITELDPVYTFDLSAVNPRVLVWIRRTRFECELHGVLVHSAWCESHMSTLWATIPNRQLVTGLLFVNDTAGTVLMGTSGGVWYIFNVQHKRLSKLPFPSPPATTGVVSTSAGEFIMLCQKITYCINATGQGIKEVGRGYSEIDEKGRVAKVHSMWSDPNNPALYRMLAIRESHNPTVAGSEASARIMLYEGNTAIKSLELRAKIPLHGFEDSDQGQPWTKFIVGDRRNAQNIPLYYILFNETTQSRVPHVYWFDYESKSVLWHYSTHGKANDGSITPLPDMLESFSKDGDEARFNDSPRLIVKTKLRKCGSVMLRGWEGVYGETGPVDSEMMAESSMEFVKQEINQSCSRPTELLLTTMMGDAPRILMFGKNPDFLEEEAMSGWEFRGVHDMKDLETPEPMDVTDSL